MQIKILDSWLREFVKTDATAQKVAELLSLSSVSVEHLERRGKDWMYDIEITTNRPDLMSVIGLARETNAILKQNNITADFVLPDPIPDSKTYHTKQARTLLSLNSHLITIQSNPKLVNRICAVIMDVNLTSSPENIKNRLEATGIRSLNNLIDITNYVMRVTGQPTHVFDYDRLHTKTLTIRESKQGDKITTLDGKSQILPGEDIIACDETGRIVDLIGIMGLENSVVTPETKRILFFIDNPDPHHIRKTSMTLGIRTEAAVLNEKVIDPELSMHALQYGIKLYKELADGKIVSEIFDIYPNKIAPKQITVSQEKISSLIGVPITLKESEIILKRLGFKTAVLQTKDLASLRVIPPTFRAQDIQIPQDVIEEIARIYGYHNIPNQLPSLATADFVHLEKNEFFWEDRMKDAMKYWGFTEVYTYPMVSEKLINSQKERSVKIANPLSEEFVYMRQSLIPSLLKVAGENNDHKTIKIFEIGNVYSKMGNDLPEQTQTFAGLIRKPANSFYEVKGLVEQLAVDLGIRMLRFKQLEEGIGAEISIEKFSPYRNQKQLSRETSEQFIPDAAFTENIGNIKILDDQTTAFELNLQELLQHATLQKTYHPPSIYPPIIEDLALTVPENILTGDIIKFIKNQNPLVIDVSLLDKYHDTKTFHIVYQSWDRNLTNEEVGKIRGKILKNLREKLHISLKE